MEKNECVTTHKLDFEAAPWHFDSDITLFRVGTCEGQWYCQDNNFVILSVINSKPGNGHFDDVLEWFEFACKRMSYNLVVDEIMNDRFKKHLLSRRGFVQHPTRKDSVIKYITHLQKVDN